MPLQPRAAAAAHAATRPPARLVQAGSDSLLTSAAFLKLAEQRFQGMEGVGAHRGILYGLGEDGRQNMMRLEDD